MITYLSALASLLSFRFRSRASLELELLALRHQVAVLRRQRLGRARLFCADRLLWVWVYRVWPPASLPTRCRAASPSTPILARWRIAAVCARSQKRALSDWQTGP